ncbi:ATP-dependent metallopeptidase FtsH/Yme1/Tma family protein [Tolypothrix sp. FACHB-123]|uniref:ATP-dependent metallopeptidase FtsH/Yme1/Tma family protein n=1 Tax=Tolypothrix sp. FACHB-123 TaxID=2692868 RepID=UPI0035BC3F0F
MTCCLNPACHNPPNPDGTMFCSNCGIGLVVLRNRYRPIKSLGAGGFGKTYLAEDIDKLNQKCVIKQFAPQVQGTGALQKATELFEQEARRLEQLGEHPQIPTLLAYFEQDNHLYLVQQFIDGQNLLDELKQQGIFNEQKIKELLLNLLDILKTVHQYKVIHRDIKPENIIRRSDGKLVLIDFGASKQLTATVMTQVGTTIGSFGYAPLEQMQGGEAYPASDLYSVGATCFHLLSGIHPWQLWQRQGYGWVASWRSHLQQPVSQELGQMLDKLLQEEYQQRYQSAEEIVQELNPSLLPSVRPNKPVTATRASMLWRAGQYAVLFLLLIVLLAVGKGFFDKQPQQRETWRYSQFIQEVEKGRVEKVSLSADRSIALVTTRDGNKVVVTLVNDPDLINTLTAKGIDISVLRQTD